MSRDYNIALAEADEIIIKMPKSMTDKIPSKVKQYIKFNKNPIHKLDLNKKIEKDTLAIISVLYMDYICSEEQRIKYYKQDKEYMEQFKERKIQEKLMKQNSKVESIVEETVEKNGNTQLIVEESSNNIFKKIINTIKIFLKKIK